MKTAVITSSSHGDIIAIAQKIISKAEGRYGAAGRCAAQVERALDVAQQTDKDPRLVELILQESDEISRLRKGVLIVRHRLGLYQRQCGY